MASQPSSSTSSSGTGTSTVLGSGESYESHVEKPPETDKMFRPYSGDQPARAPTRRHVERESEKSKGEDDIDNGSEKLPNGGYGWVCVGCVFWINVCTWGISSVCFLNVYFTPAPDFMSKMNFNQLTVIRVIRHISCSLPIHENFSGGDDASICFHRWSLGFSGAFVLAFDHEFAENIQHSNNTSHGCLASIHCLGRHLFRHQNMALVFVIWPVIWLGNWVLHCQYCWHNSSVVFDTSLPSEWYCNSGRRRWWYYIQSGNKCYDSTYRSRLDLESTGFD